MAKDKDPKLTKDGVPDNRGRSAGSKATQFAKDDGRRRPGRPKKSADQRTIVDRIRNTPVGLKPDGTRRRRSVTMQEAILLAQSKKALAGDTRAAQYVQNLIDRYEAPVVDPNETAKLLEEDREVLAWAKIRGVLPRGGDDE